MPDQPPDRVPDDTPQTSPRPRAMPGGLASLWAGITDRPRRGQVIVAVLVGVLGFAAVVQVRLIHTSDTFGGQDRQNLVVLLDSLSGATQRTQKQVNALQHTRVQLLTGNKRRAVAIKAGRSRLAVLGILAGTEPAVGPGVTITIHDPTSSVSAAAFLNGIEELRDAGAEAIEINDKVRVVASTSFTERSGVLVADGIELRPPYVIDAIGSSHTLAEAVVFPGGLSDEVKQLGGTMVVRQADQVQVGSLHTLKPLQYAHPTGS